MDLTATWLYYARYPSQYVVQILLHETTWSTGADYKFKALLMALIAKENWSNLYNAKSSVNATYRISREESTKL